MGIFCTACGHENADGLNFCCECGTKLAAPAGIVCSACGHANAPGMNFCSGCGTPLSADVTTLSLNKESYGNSDQIIVSVKKLKDDMAEEGAFIAIFKSGADHTECMDIEYPQAGDSRFTYNAPYECGDYEIRLYRSEGMKNASGFITSVPFTVTPSEQATEVILDKPSYTTQDKISVIVKRISQRMYDEGAFVAVFKPGADHSDYKEIEYLQVGDCRRIFNAPEASGDYEVRLYRYESPHDEAGLVISVPFTVTESDKVTGITLDKPAYAPESEIIVNVKAVSPRMESEGAFVGIFTPGAWHEDSIGREYPRSGDNRITIEAPADEGNYEMRLYRREMSLDDTAIVTTLAFTVGAAVAGAPMGGAPAGGLACPACGFENVPGTKFCNKCGTKLAAPAEGVCPACGKENAPGMNFCGGCGSKIG